MYYCSNYVLAILFCVITMLCWGSWGNTQKLAGKTWRYELFYWDYVLGVVLFALVSGLTAGSMGENAAWGFVATLRQASPGNLASAFLGGVVFNAANILLAAAISIAGMSVAFPIGIGLALVLGVIVNYVGAPKGDAMTLFGGVALIVVAILCNAVAYKLKQSASPTIKQSNNPTIQQSNTLLKGIVLSIVCGTLMAFFYRFIACTMDLDFAKAAPAAGMMSPYSAFFVFSLGIFASTFVFNAIAMRHPVSGEPITEAAYFKGSFRIHLVGILGGLIWGLGNGINLVAAGKAGAAISYGLGQGATLVSALWGILVWKEFRGAPRKAGLLNFAMFVIFLLGLGLIIAAGREPAPGQLKVRTFGPGVHYLTETAVLTAADSGTVWKAAPCAKPVISGARKVAGWRKAEGGLWCADVPWVTGRENGFRQLTVNGEPRPRAKHPNKDYFHSLEFPRPAGVTWFQWEYGYSKMRFRINPGEIDPKWDLSKGEVIFYHIWNDSHCPADLLTVENGTNWLNLAECVRRNPCGCPWRLENLKEIADLPGEWALDYDAKRVYYRPCAGEDPSTAEIAVPFLETLVKIDGAKGVRFEGLAFENSRYELARDQRNDLQASQGISAAVVLTNATGCTFERCAFRKLSGYAIDFKAGTCDSKVSRCRMTALGAGGVRLNHAVPRLANTTTNLGYSAYQMPDPRVRIRGNEISDCEIGDYGRDFPSAVGVLLMNAEDTKVIHNDIHDGYYTGVSVGWNWGYHPSVARDNLIEYNHIWNIGKGLISDMGGIYLLGIAPGTKVRNNLIHDVDARFYGGWGIYPDEGSSDLLIENNVVYNTKFAPFHQHFGRNNTVRNNVFAGGKIDQLAGSRWEPHTRFFFYNNIVYWREGKLHTGNWADDKTYSYLRIPPTLRTEPEWKLKKTTECDYNLYFNPTKALKDVQWGTQNCSWDDWRGKYLQDKHSVWGDPLFVDAAKHDYRLRPDSPALKLGFRPIDLSTVGPRD